jgi:hypothetical protein
MIEVLDTAAARRLLERRLLRCAGCNAPLKPWGRGQGPDLLPTVERTNRIVLALDALAAAALAREANRGGPDGEGDLAQARQRVPVTASAATTIPQWPCC